MLHDSADTPTTSSRRGRLAGLTIIAAAVVVVIAAVLLMRGQRPDLSTDPTLYTVGYAHLDTQWRWDYVTTIADYIPRTMHDNFALFEKYPDYVFNFSGANRYRMMKEYYPEDYERVKRYVAAGRWFPSGSAMEESDVNVPSSESLVRQILYGTQFFRQEFGRSDHSKHDSLRIEDVHVGAEGVHHVDGPLPVQGHAPGPVEGAGAVAVGPVDAEGHVHFALAVEGQGMGAVIAIKGIRCKLGVGIPEGIGGLVDQGLGPGITLLDIGHAVGNQNPHDFTPGNSAEVLRDDEVYEIVDVRKSIAAQLVKLCLMMMTGFALFPLFANVVYTICSLKAEQID